MAAVVKLTENFTSISVDFIAHPAKDLFISGVMGIHHRPSHLTGRRNALCDAHQAGPASGTLYVMHGQPLRSEAVFLISVIVAVICPMCQKDDSVF